MEQDEYTLIVSRFYENLARPFMNFIRSKFQSLQADEIEDIYSQVWMDVRENIKKGKVEKNTTWKSYIFRMGMNQANNLVSRRPSIHSIDVRTDDSDTFNPIIFEVEKKQMGNSELTIYSDPETQEVLARELSCIPEPCNSVLKYYYYESMSMREIAAAMNYSGESTAKVTKKRCQDRLKDRVLKVIRQLGIID